MMRSGFRSSFAWILALALCAVATGARAQFNLPAKDKPKELKGSDVVEHLGATVPLDLKFKDDQGHAVKLADYFKGKRPVILQMGYYECPMLCSLISQGLTQSLNHLTLDPEKDFQVLYVSIDPGEGPDLAARKKASIVEGWGKPGADKALHLLTGDRDTIQKLADTVGFKFAWVPNTRQFAHPAVLMVLSPEGKVTRYLYGVTYDQTTLRLSLVEASEGKIGNTVDRFILTCFQYDGTVGKYALIAIRLVQIGGVVTVLILGTVIFMLVRWEKRRNRAHTVAAQATH